MQDPTTIESLRAAVLECAEAIGALRAEVVALRAEEVSDDEA